MPVATCGQRFQGFAKFVPEGRLDELDRSLESGTDEQCLQALWRITDLFITGATRYTDEQVGLFDDVIARLMTAIESKARAKLASRLAPIPNAPAKVIRSLAFKWIRILFRCWKEHRPYDEAAYQRALAARRPREQPNGPCVEVQWEKVAGFSKIVASAT